METKLQQVECPQCLSGRVCRLSSDRYRMVVMSWAHGRQVPDCPGFSPRWYHGVEGVVAFPYEGMTRGRS